MSQICIRHLSWDADVKEGWTALHTDTAKTHTQTYIKTKRPCTLSFTPGILQGARLRRGLPWRPVHCSLFPQSTVAWWLPPSSHAHTHTHMHHKYFHVHTVTSKHTHTDTVYYHTNQQSHSTCSVYSVFLHKISGSGLIHLQLDTHTSSDLTQNRFFLASYWIFAVINRHHRFRPNSILCLSHS